MEIHQYQKLMENEISNFFKVWVTVFASLCYCYAVGQAVPKGVKRFSFLLPIVCLFLYLPLYLYTMHLGGTSAFFISWLANFKILLFAFGKGPLSLDPSISLPRFAAVACLPIKIQHSPSPKGEKQKNPPSQPPKYHKKSALNYGIKVPLLAVLIHVHDYRDYINPQILSFLYFLYMYIALELVLALVAFMAKAWLGVELEPQFNEPYLSSSLQDFWGRRWNLMVPSILKPTVYEPTCSLARPLVGRNWAPIPAVLCTFLMSGLMHELIFYYLGRERPTWELTCFFLLHGFSVMAEIAIKKAFAKKRKLPWLISGPLSIGFVMFTASWLFLPSLNQCKAFERGSIESAAALKFLENAKNYIPIQLIHKSISDCMFHEVKN